MEKQNYIGRKVKGFSFVDTDTCTEADEMHEYIGKIGTIISYDEYGNFDVLFEDHETWYYPSAFIDEHLLPIEQDETELRDQFAMQAMNGILSAQSEMRANGHCNTVEGIKYLAEESYLIADALLKARKEVKGE